MKTLSIGDYSHDGVLQVVDTAWDGNGTLRVTVRELIGERFHNKSKRYANTVRRARYLARKCLPEYYPRQTKRAPLIRVFYTDGCTHFTFSVSRIER